MENGLALQVKNLTVALNNQKIIEDLSFEVKKGETLGMVGESPRETVYICPELS